VDVRAGRAGEKVDDLADIVEPPLLPERGIVRRDVIDREDVVRLGIADAWIALEPCDRASGGCAVRAATAFRPWNFLGA
jgi:hypothetical protein